MKVCFLTGEYPPMQGGVADHTAHLARHLAGLGVDVSVLTSIEAASNTYAAPSCTVLPDSSSRTAWARKPAQLAGRRGGRKCFQSPVPNLHVYPNITGWGLGCWRQIGHWLDEHRPDVLHIQYQAAAYALRGWPMWLPWWLRRRRARPRVVVTFHDLRVPYLFPKAGPLRWRSVLVLARHSDGVIVTNAEDEQRLRKVLMPNNLTLIPLGSNVHPQPPSDYDRYGWRAQMGIGEHTLLLAYFGFLNESKGGEDLVLALEHLVRQGYDAHLLMIGGQVGDVDPTNRAYAERVRSLVRTCGLAERVHWTGFTSPEEVSANLLAADVVVMPYRDGVSFRRTTFIAALCHGRPVVTTCPTIPLFELRDGENVLLVPPRDVGSLTESIARLADDAELRARLSAAAEALGGQFDWAAISQRTLGLYRRLELE